MNIRSTEEGARMTVSLMGELDHHAAKDVMNKLDRQIEVGLPRELVLDLGGLTFTDSSGIAVLLRAARRMGELQGSLRVVAAPAQARKVFGAAGLERMIRFEERDERCESGCGCL